MTFFTTVANDIGKDYVFNPNNHPSLNKIKERKFTPENFNFEHTNQTKISKIQGGMRIRELTAFK